MSPGLFLGDPSAFSLESCPIVYLAIWWVLLFLVTCSIFDDFFVSKSTLKRQLTERHTGCSLSIISKNCSEHTNNVHTLVTSSIIASATSSLAPDCKPAPILAEHTVWEIQRNGPYSDWHSRFFWTRDQGNDQTCCTIGQSAVTNDYLIIIHNYVMINN